MYFYRLVVRAIAYQRTHPVSEDRGHGVVHDEAFLCVCDVCLAINKTDIIIYFVITYRYTSCVLVIIK